MRSQFMRFFQWRGLRSRTLNDATSDAITFGGDPITYSAEAVTHG